MFFQTSKFRIAAYARGDKIAAKVALVLPGFLDTKDYNHLRSHVDFLADHGYYAVGIDMPGTWGSSGTIAEFTITNCLDVVDEFLKKFGRSAVLVGHSNGGRIALHAAARNDFVCSVVAIMPPLHTLSVDDESESVKKWKETGFKFSRRVLPNDSEKFQEFAIPLSFLEDSQGYNLGLDLQRLTTPKLFVAGKLDELIKPEEVKEAYMIASNPKKYRIVASAHDYRSDVDSIANINELIGQFVINA